MKPKKRWAAELLRLDFQMRIRTVRLVWSPMRAPRSKSEFGPTTSDLIAFVGNWSNSRQKPKGALVPMSLAAQNRWLQHGRRRQKPAIIDGATERS